VKRNLLIILNQKILIKSFNWVRELKQQLLSKESFTDKDIDDFTTLINEIITQWNTVTGDTPFPKLHMLKHAAEFVEKWKCLGRVGESQIESMHAKCNSLYHNNHSNCGNNTNTRLLRTP